MFYFISKKKEEKNYLLDPNKKMRKYSNLMEGDQLKTFKRPNPDSYLTVSVKKAGEFNQNDNPNLYYVQIVEPISDMNKQLTTNTNEQRLTIKQRWHASQTKELVRLVTCLNIYIGLF